MVDTITAEIGAATDWNVRRMSYSNTTPVNLIDWQGDLTGYYWRATAIYGSTEIPLNVTVSNPASGIMQVTWDVGALSPKLWRINVDIESGGLVSTVVWTQEVRDSVASLASAPVVSAVPADVSALVGDAVAGVDPADVFSWPSESIAPITFSVPSGTGVSYNSGTGLFEFDTSSELRDPGSDITLRADNSPLGGATDATFNLLINPQLPNMLGGLADQSYVLGNGVQTVDISADLDPAGGPADSYELVAPIPAGVTISGSVVSYANDALGSSTIQYRAVNVTGNSATRAFQVTTATANSATLNALQANFAVLNTGQSYAISGGTSSGSDGLTVEARVVDASTSAQISGWADVGTVASSAWSGSITIPNTGKAAARVEARIKFSTAAAAQSTETFIGGHTFTVFGQSEYAYWEQSQNNPGGAAETIPTGQGRVFLMSRGAVGLNEITDQSTGLTPAIAGFVASLMRTAPNETVLVVLHTASGTDPRDWVDDSNGSGRDWATDQTTADAVHAMGTEMGMVNYSWWHSTTSLAANWDTAMCPIITGHLLDGTDLRSTITSTGYDHNGQQIDHYLMELYPEAELVFGDHQESIPTNGDYLYIDSTDPDTHQQREGARNIAAALPSLFASDPWLMPLYHYEVNNGPTEDVTHPDATTLGIVLMAKTAAVSWAAGLGLVSIPRPTLSLTSISSSQIVIGSPEGDLTTLRQINSEAELSPATNWWWGEALGVHVNGKAIGGVTIDGNGDLVCTTAFPIDGADIIGFGGGGNMGHMQQTADGFNQAWRSLPGVTIAGQEVDLIPIQAPVTLTNTLAAPTRWVQGASAPAYWRSTASITTAAAFYAAFDVECNLDNSNYLMDWGGITVRMLSQGRLAVLVKDSAGTTVANQTTVNDVMYGLLGSRRARIAIGVRLTGAGGDIVVHADGEQIIAATLSANTGLLPSAQCYLAARSNGGSTIGARTFENYTFAWSTDDAAYTGGNYLADGTAPSGGTITSVVIAGDAATVNAGFIGWDSLGSSVTDAA